MRVGLAMLLAVLLSGCALFHNNTSAQVYDMSYDQTYATAVGALNDMQTDHMDSWHLQSTDVANGIIVVARGAYFLDEKRVKFQVYKLGPYRTMVKLRGQKATPFTEKFFRAMDKRVAELALTKPS